MIAQSHNTSAIPRADGIVMGGVFLFSVAISFFLYQPGYMSVDSLFQLELVREGRYHDQMPILMTTLWRGLHTLVPGPAAMLMFHLLMYWGGLALIFRYARGPLWLRATLVMMIGFFPGFFSIIGILWKDISMVSALLMSLGILLAIMRTGRRVLWLPLAVALVYAFDARSNSLGAVLPVLLLAAYVLGGSTARASGRWFWVCGVAGLALCA